MKEVYPDGYQSFQCIASACRHSCCIGWEIDIDEDTAARYAELPGLMGERLRENFLVGDTASFRLGEDERCPFLNRDNLCELILNLGEDSLCDICRLHPRFFHWYDNRVEQGLGLCCEAAAALIMGRQEPFRLVSVGEETTLPPELAFRDSLLELLTSRDLSLEERCRRMLERCGAELPAGCAEEWVTVFLRLEQLEPQWTAVLQQLQTLWPSLDFLGFRAKATAWETEYEQLLCYFLYRHFLDMAEEFGAGAAAAFAVLSCGMIFCLHAVHAAVNGDISLETRIEYARQYSAEIEYSDCNPGVLLEVLSEKISAKCK